MTNTIKTIKNVLSRTIYIIALFAAWWVYKLLEQAGTFKHAGFVTAFVFLIVFAVLIVWAADGTIKRNPELFDKE